jgi:bifunctional non-homologous end joining protein LigD
VSIRNSPRFVVPMAAESVPVLPDGPDWSYELKLDGYRALLIKDGARIQLRSRNNKDLARLYPTVIRAAQTLTPNSVILDGEIVALDARGRPTFQALQHRESYPEHQIVYYVFDILHVDGRDLMQQPLVRRQVRLPKILPENGTIRLSVSLPGSASAVLAAVRAAGLEGVIAKRRNSRYLAGERSTDWQKLKLERQQELVIGGYRGNVADGVDALLVGHYEKRRLYFAGKVRAGMVPHVRRELLRELQKLQISDCPFVNLPDVKRSRWGGGITLEEMHDMKWVRPKLVAQIRFQEWTSEGRLRLSKFLGLRTDKAAAEVRREF